MKKIDNKRKFNSKTKRADLEKQVLKNFSAVELRKVAPVKGSKKSIISKVKASFLYDILNEKIPYKKNNQIEILSTEKGIDSKMDKIESFRDKQIGQMLKGAKSVRIIFQRGVSASTRRKMLKEGKEIPEYFEDFGAVTPNNKVKTQKDLMEFISDTMETMRTKIADSLKPNEEPYNIRKIYLKFYYNETK
jgi:DNA-directed RNA polymerase subunit F